MVVATKEQVDGLFNIGGVSRKGVTYVDDVEKMLATNMMQVMSKMAARIVDNLAKNAPVDKGKLSDPKIYRVDQIKETKTGYRLEIVVGADYADYIDKGVKGVKNSIKNRKTFPNADGKYYQFKNYYLPPEALKGLEGWMRRKNMEIEATNLIEGRNVLPQISSSVTRMAYFIKKYGIEGRQFIKKSIDASTPNFNVDIQSIGGASLVLRISK